MFVAIFPPIPNWAMCMCKDSLFSAVFILYFVAFIEIVRTKGAALGSKRFLACYVILSGLCILTKKPGVYIFILSGFVLLVVYRRFWKRTLVAYCAVFATPFHAPLLQRSMADCHVAMRVALIARGAQAPLLANTAGYALSRCACASTRRLQYG
ncbi:DUF6020 family protein [Ellagibacter isourolithinifaciens]|uniref:DUF6020 family protein n=1 Tax=Ellagibacter isourolithinifaciens TaxID=2137581 RepID=UPI003A95328A